MSKEIGDSDTPETVDEGAVSKAFEEMAARMMPEDKPAAESDALKQGAEEADEQVLSHDAEPQPPKPEEGEGDDGKLAPEVQESINKRIGKEVAKTKAERERAEALEAKLRDAEARLDEASKREPDSIPIRNLDGPLSHVLTPAQLEAEVAKAESVVEFVENQLDLVDDDPVSVAATLRKSKINLTNDAGEDDYSPGRMKMFLRSVRSNASKVIKAAPKREKWIEENAHWQKQAEEWMPELKDRSHARYQKFQQVITGFPALKQNAVYPFDAMIRVLGWERWEEMKAARENGKGKKPEPTKAAETPTKLPTVGAKVPPGKVPMANDYETTKAKALQTGLMEDVERHMEKIAANLI